MRLRIYIILFLVASVISSKAQTSKTYTSFESALANPELVFHLSIRKTGITKIPAEIGKLKNLITLNLEKNQITEIPKEIGLLTNLQILDLDQNNIKIIPEEIGNLTKLTELDLDKNQIRALPASIGRLVNLTHFDINSNLIQALPEEIGNLTGLIEFKPNMNQLTELPASIGNLKKLTQLDLSFNRLQHLPASIGKLVLLTELHLNNNLLTTLPAEIGNLIALKVLPLYNNQLTSLPEEIGNCHLLVVFSASENKLHSLPKTFSKLTRLEQVQLSKNNFDSIPQWVFDLPKLNQLAMNENKIQFIPVEIGKAQALESLGLRFNQIKIIPVQLTWVKSLRHLFLTGNPLESFPKEISALKNLSIISFDESEIKILPLEIIDIRTLHVIYLLESHNDYKPLKEITKHQLIELMGLSHALTPEKQRMLTKNLWLNELVDEIGQSGSLWNAFQTGTFTNEGEILFYFLLSAATVDDLINLTNDHDATVRVYALKALEEKKYSDIFSLALQHLDDAETPKGSYASSGNFFVTSKLLSPQQRNHLDSLLIFEYHKINYINFILDTLPPLEKYYARAQEMSKYSSQAVVFLAKYKREKDIEVIKNRIISDPGIALKAVQYFPHAEFKSVLEQLAGNRNFIHSFIPAVAAYRDAFSVQQLNKLTAGLNLSSYEDEKIAHTIFALNDTVFMPVYLSILKINPCLITDSLMFSSRLSASVKWIELAQTAIVHCRYAGTGKKAKLAKQVALKYPEAYKKVLADVIAHARFGGSDRDYFFEEAKKTKDPEVIGALFKLLTGGENDYSATALNVLLSYNDTSLYQPIVVHLVNKKHLYAWQEKEMRSGLVKHNLLKRVIAASKRRQPEIFGAWRFTSLQKSDAAARKAPEWSEIRFNEDSTYVIIHGYDKCRGKFSINASAIKIDTAADCRPNFVNDDLSGGFSAPLPCISAPAAIHHYYYYRPDKPDTTNNYFYEANIKALLHEINTYTVTEKNLGLNGKSQIKLLRIDDWYTDWNKIPVNNKTGNNLPYNPAKVNPPKKTLKNIPATIAGKPLSFYLNRNDIDKNAKLFIQGKLAIYTEDHDERVQQMLDSVLTRNPATATFYLQVFNALMEMGWKYESYSIKYAVSDLCLTYILKNPCAFFKEIKYGAYKISYTKWVSTFSESSRFYRLKILEDGIRNHLTEHCSVYLKDVADFIHLVETSRH